MNRSAIHIATVLGLLTASATAQVQLNEVFISHVGSPDDQEFVELRGPASTSLSGYMVLFVEGDVASAAGSLDFAIDLSAGTIGASGLYTAGAIGVSPGVDQIVTGPGANPNVNLFENGTQNVYLIHTTDVAAVMALLGTDLRIGGSGTVTTLTTDPTITIHDMLAFYDPLGGGTIFDGAPVFQDGNFVPAGVARCGNAPYSWNLLDFDFTPSPGFFDISPTAPNPDCEVVPPTGTAYCFGDGSGTACPCGNHSPAGSGEGCLHSFGTGGKLDGTGSASLAADTVVLTGSGMPNSSALYFQGSSQQNGGAGTLFGDGLRCAGGATVRLGTQSNVAGTSSYPGAGDASISVRGLVTAPGTRTYQCWYRNAAAFCTAATFNLTNGYEIVWGN